ncbi:hypothetical protein [Streptacidiphilus sp. EB129]|uniref:hypothetical protein n=1 Tax=Streptacidiphilus sp. EB129 TaxID=3156262 RepID=UPI0035166E87
MKRTLVAFALLAGLIAVGSGTAQASGPITISSTRIYTGHGVGNRVGTLLQTYDPGTRTAQASWWPTGWDSGTGPLEKPTIWLENGPNTHTLISATDNGYIDAFSTLPYSIDLLQYPKTIDAAIHIKYQYDYIDVWGETKFQVCDLWIAGAAHDYSTGANNGGRTSVTC